jgi:hypothetical protein
MMLSAYDSIVTYWPYITRIADLNLKLRYYCTCTHNQTRFSDILTELSDSYKLLQFIPRRRRICTNISQSKMNFA